MCYLGFEHPDDALRQRARFPALSQLSPTLPKEGMIAALARRFVYLLETN